MTPSTEQPIACCRVQVRGRVQGVNYRDSCVQQARQRGITGWVRNRRDGSVEVLLQGPPAPMAALKAWLSEGPPAATVTGLQITAIPAPFDRLATFERRATE